MLWLFFLILIIIAILLYAEYSAHDCVPGKICTHNSKPPTKSDNKVEYVDKIRKMVRNNYDYISWRQALLVALIVLIPLVYFIYQRLPDLYEFFVITTIVFLGIYFSSIWIWTHFFYPNGLSIEKSLLKLRDKLTDKDDEDSEESILTDILQESFSYTFS